MEEAVETQPVERTPTGPLSQRPRTRRSVTRVLKFGCLTLALTLCGGIGLLGWALQSGPVMLQLPGGSTLKVGSDDFVLSNYSFQNGTTYYIDLHGKEVRNILQLHYLEDAHRLELVFHYAGLTELGEHHLAEMSLP